MKTHVSHTGRSSPHRGAGDYFSGMRSVGVAPYVRVPTDKQAEFGMSLGVQRTELQRYLKILVEHPIEGPWLK